MAKYQRLPNLKCKNYYLTYPKCLVTKEQLLQNVMDMWGNRLKFVVICTEQHQDGSDHLHAVLSFHKQTRTSFKTLTGLTGKYGNYQPVRKMMDVMKYITKDGDYISHGVNVDQFLSLMKEKKSTAIAFMCQDGKTLQEINEVAPGFLMMHLDKVKAYLKLQQQFQQQDCKLAPGTIQFFSSSPDPAVQALKKWLDLNILAHTRDFKQPQLYLHSVPNKGKTTLIMNMIKAGIRVYFMPYEDFYCTYADDCYDVIVLDEFKGQKRIQDLNQWLDGSQFPVRRKGAPPLIKKDNLPMIILSNYPLAECYKVPYERLAPLETRLEQIEVDTFIDIQMIPLDEMDDDDDDDD